MKDVLLTLLHLAVTAAKLCGPGGVRAVIAENLLLKQQLIVLRRSRRRAPNLTVGDRLLCGFGSLFLSPGRISLIRAVGILALATVGVGLGVHCGAVDGPSLCRMFNDAIRGRGAPRHLSTDHDPLFEDHRRQANLRILKVDEIKTVPMTIPGLRRIWASSLGACRRAGPGERSTSACRQPLGTV